MKLKSRHTIQSFCLCMGLCLCGCNGKHLSNSEVQSNLQQIRTFLDNRQIENAIYLLKQLRQDRPYDAQVLELLGVAYSECKQFYLAAQTFENAVYADASGNFKENALYAAQIYKQIQNLDACARCYRLYLDYFFEDGTAWFALSEVELQLNHPKTALSAFLRGLDTLKAYPTIDYRIKLSQLCFLNGYLEAASYWILKALEEQSDAVPLYLQALRIAHAQKDTALVLSLIAKVESLDNTLSNQKYLVDLKEKYQPKKSLMLAARETDSQRTDYNYKQEKSLLGDEAFIEILCQIILQHVQKNLQVMNVMKVRKPSTFLSYRLYPVSL